MNSTVSGDSKSGNDKEDLLLKNFNARERTAVKYPYRPCYGTNGELVELQANFFKLQLPDQLALFGYNIKIERLDETEKAPLSEAKEKKKLSEVKGKKLKQIISLRLRDLKKEMASRGPKCYVATDYKSNLVCTTEIPQNLRNAEVTYRHEDDPAAPNSRKSAKYDVQLVEATTHLRASQLKEFFTLPKSDARYENKEPMVQALNILFGHYAKSTPTTTMVGGNRAFTRDKFTEKEPLGAGVEAVRGYFLSVRLCSSSSMVNVNVSHSAFYETIPLADFMRKLLSKLGDSDDAYYRLENLVRGLQVKTKVKDRSENEVTKVFSLKAFATTSDGQEQSHPPLVEVFAAQPSKVWFYLDDPSKFEKQMQPLKKEGGRIRNYINVRDYFWISMYLWPQTAFLTNFRRVWNTFRSG